MRNPAPLIEALGGDLTKWFHNCHAASIELVQSGVLEPEARVARGFCRGVGSQHSWVVLGNPYASDIEIIDPTLWSYTTNIPKIEFTSAKAKSHIPHGGEGTLFTYGMPPFPVEPIIKLTQELSGTAQTFLKFVAPHGLDRRGWHILAHAPVAGWPAREIIDAMCEIAQLRVLIPVDIIGMLTDRNPGGLYLRKGD